MSDLQGSGGVMRATIQVKRAATGKVETFEIIGCTDPEKLPGLVAEARRTREHGAAGAMVGQPSILSTQPRED